MNAHGSNHRLGVPSGVPGAITWLAIVVQPGEVPLVMLPRLRPGTRFGLSLQGGELLICEFELLANKQGVNGNPVRIVSIPDTHQPPNILPANPAD